MDPRLRARRIEVMRGRGRRRLRWVMTTLGVVALALVVFAVSRSPIFDVDTIAVQGAERTSTEAVVAAAEPLLSQPLLEVDIEPVAGAIAALPWVAEVSSSTALDGTVTFDITEREAIAAVVGASGWLLVDLDGRVLERVEVLPGDVVLVDGAVFDAEPGQWVSEQVLAAIELASLLPAALASDVASVQRGDDLELVLYGGGRVVIGDAAELDEKFLATLTLLDQVGLECLDRIDVRAPTVPVLTRLPDCS